MAKGYEAGKRKDILSENHDDRGYNPVPPNTAIP
jgi:hypothetical protein